MKNVRTGRIGAAVGVLVLTLVGLAAPAGATPPSESWQETWDDTDVVVCDGGTADTSDDLTIEGHIVGSMDFVLRERGNTGLYYIAIHGQESGTYTNVDNDLYWTSTNTWREKDLDVSEDEDGILTIRVGTSFLFKVHSADGIPGGVNAGRSEFTIVYDPATDTELSFTVTKEVGARTTTDFCDDAFRYTS